MLTKAQRLTALAARVLVVIGVLLLPG